MKVRRNTRRIDLRSTCHGTIISLQAPSAKGRRWLAANVPDQEHGAVLAEHRYGVDILQGALDGGLTLHDSTTGRVRSTARKQGKTE